MNENITDKNEVTYDLFTDASVGPELRGCCSGVLITRRDNRYRTFTELIQPKGTNNSGEVAAVCLAVSHIRNLVDWYVNINPGPMPDLTFNVFSDSLITVNGVRSWIVGWIKNMDKLGNLMNNSETIVANQNFFKFIYNTILDYNLRIRFIHQPAHVLTNVDKIIKPFANNNNGFTPEHFGITPIQLCSCNDFVDRETRGIINLYLSTNPEDRPEYQRDEILKMKMGAIIERKIRYTSKEDMDRYLGLVSLY